MAPRQMIASCTPVCDLYIPHSSPVSSIKTRKRSNATTLSTYTLRPSAHSQTAMKFESPAGFKVSVTGPRPGKVIEEGENIPVVAPGSLYNRPQPAVEVPTKVRVDGDDEEEDPEAETEQRSPFSWVPPRATTTITVINDGSVDSFDSPRCARLVGLGPIPDYELPGAEPIERPSAKLVRCNDDDDHKRETTLVGAGDDDEDNYVEVPCPLPSLFDELSAAHDGEFGDTSPPLLGRRHDWSQKFDFEEYDALYNEEDDGTDDLPARPAVRLCTPDGDDDGDDLPSPSRVLPSLLSAEDDEEEEDEQTELYECGIPGHLPHLGPQNCAGSDVDDYDSLSEHSVSRSPSPLNRVLASIASVTRSFMVVAGRKRGRSPSPEPVEAPESFVHRQTKKLKLVRAF